MILPPHLYHVIICLLCYSFPGSSSGLQKFASTSLFRGFVHRVLYQPYRTSLPAHWMKTESVMDDDAGDERLGYSYKRGRVSVSGDMYVQEEQEDLWTLHLIEEALQKRRDADSGKGYVSAVVKQELNVGLNELNRYAKRQFIMGNFTAAQEAYNLCIDCDPRDGRAYLGLGRIHWKRGRSDLAEQAYQAGLYYSPKNAFLHQAQAVLCEKQGKLEEAKKILINALKHNKRHVASWCSLGHVNKRLGDTEGAKRCYECAVEQDSKCYVAYQAWAILEASSGDSQKARDLFERAIAVAPTSTHSFHAYAVMERNVGNYDRALELYQSILSFLPQSTRALLGIAEVNELKGDFAAVKEAYVVGRGEARAKGDGGFLQSWAMFEQRQLEGQVGRLVKYVRRVYSPELSLFFNQFTGLTLVQKALLAEAFDLNEEDDAEALAAGSKGSKYEAIDQLGAICAIVTANEQLFTQALSNPSLLTSHFPKIDATIIKYLVDIHRQIKCIRELFSEAIKANKYHSASYVNFAAFEQRLGNYESARKLLIGGISVYPNSKNLSYFHLALAKLQIVGYKDLQTARMCFSRALESCVQYKQLPVFLEFIHFEQYVMRSSREAKKLLDAALKKFPDNRNLLSLQMELQE